MLHSFNVSITHLINSTFLVPNCPYLNSLDFWLIKYHLLNLSYLEALHLISWNALPNTGIIWKDVLLIDKVLHEALLPDYSSKVVLLCQLLLDLIMIPTFIFLLSQFCEEKTAWIKGKIKTYKSNFWTEIKKRKYVCLEVEFHN
jgi:hypothetical protein